MNTCLVYARSWVWWPLYQKGAIALKPRLNKLLTFVHYQLVKVDLQGTPLGLGSYLSQSSVYLCKHEDLSSIPSTHVKKLDYMGYVCSLGSGEIETGEFLGLLVNQFSLISKPQVLVGNPISKTKLDSFWGTTFEVVWPAQAYVCVHLRARPFLDTYTQNL